MSPGHLPINSPSEEERPLTFEHWQLFPNIPSTSKQTASHHYKQATIKSHRNQFVIGHFVGAELVNVVIPEQLNGSKCVCVCVEV